MGGSEEIFVVKTSGQIIGKINKAKMVEIILQKEGQRLGGLLKILNRKTEGVINFFKSADTIKRFVGAMAGEFEKSS